MSHKFYYVTFVLLWSALSFAQGPKCDLAGLEMNPAREVWESIPRSLDLTTGPMRIISDHYGTTWVTTIDMGDKRGVVSRAIDMKKKEICFGGIDLKAGGVPSFIDAPGVTPLVPGRGVPTAAFITAMQMKLAGVAYGGLRTATTNPINNERTTRELRDNPAIAEWTRAHPSEAPPGRLIADAILSTNTGRYIQTVLAISGHRITSIEVTGGTAELADFEVHFKLAPR